MRRIALMIMLMFLLVNNAIADELIFPESDQYVSKLDFRLEIFDLKFNYLDVYRKPSHVQSINSVGFYKKIMSYVYLRDSFTQVPKDMKKRMLRDICEQLFRIYKDNFVMMYETEHEAMKAGTRKSAPGHQMKPYHLEIQILQGSPWKTIGTWYGGYLELENE